ncbi:MAG: HEAT repeat domain-containing protein [Isosphaeraceae bacterium]|nr:HEAT repeat domain-containing protein [Isosphaeraceae bacterium]
MTSRSLFAILATIAVGVFVGTTRAEAGQIQRDGHTFTLPDGFTIERIAGPPLVDRPIVADFDEQGRLYVADSSGSNDPVQKQLEEKPHRIVRLEDTDGDGRFDQRTVFADRMMFPEGCMWFDGSLYVAAPPSIWKLTDTDGDGVADRREEWFQGKTLTGCANDLHGPYLGPDGWIYWCKGAFAKQTYERPGKPPFVTRAAHIFRCRPDGSGIEPVMTGGMDNPVDVVFTPGGERIFTTTFFQRPEGGRRDGLIHAIYGGVYGKVHDVIEEHPRTSPDVMPVLTHLGPAAPCGLTRYESAVFGASYRDNLFACLFNLQKVTRHVLRPEGATFTTSDEDFLVSNNKDFHPTDVLEDADGSLIVIDTGGWYKLCCPTSQLHKPDVLGAIYRVRRQDAPRVEDPRGQKWDWSRMTIVDLALRLDDPRPAVRRRAIEALARRGVDAVSALKVVQAGGSIEARRNAVWAAARIDAPEARAVVRSALSDPEGTVRQAAIHSISIWRDAEAVPLLIHLIRDRSQRDTTPNRRAAAEALGRIGNRAAVPALLEATTDAPDRALEHSLIFALIEIADPQGTAAGLQSTDARTRRAALIALDQMTGGGLTPEAVMPLLASSDPAMKATAAWIVGRHPEWGEALAGYLRDRLAQKDLADSDRVEVEQQLARLSRATAIQDLLADRLRDASAPPQVRLIALRAMAQAGLKQAPEAWIEGLAAILEANDLNLIRTAISTVRSLALPKGKAEGLKAALLRVGTRGDAPAEVRLEALAAAPGGLAEVSPELFAFLRKQLDPERPVAARTAAADVLSRAKLTPEQQDTLIETIRIAGPLEIDRLLAAFEASKDDEIGLKLIAALKDAPALSSLRVEALKPRLAKFGPRVQERAEELYATLNADAAKQKARLEELLASLASGDIRRGQAVFNSSKAACSSCHAIGYLGGKVGPDLTHIGKIRTERDLLESIVFPSASFVRSYEPVVVATQDGQVYSGVLKKDAADEVVLVTSATEEARIPRDRIEAMRPGTVSVMPAGLDQQLTPQELADLVAFLKACK